MQGDLQGYVSQHAGKNGNFRPLDRDFLGIVWNITAEESSRCIGVHSYASPLCRYVVTTLRR